MFIYAKHFKQKSEGQGPILMELFPFVVLNGFLYSFYAIIGHTRADQLLLQHLMEQFDLFSIQCRYIEHMHEIVWVRKNIFLQNDSYENLFPK